KMLIFNNDTDDGLMSIKGRIKNYLLKNEDTNTTLYLFSPKENSLPKESKKFKEIIESLGAKPLSSLEKVITKKQSLEQKARDENLVVINNLIVDDLARNHKSKLTQTTTTILIDK